MAEYPTDDRWSDSSPERPCAFVNTNSGERSAACFVFDQLKKHFGADNVFNLFPEKGKPPAIEEAKKFVVQRKPDFLVVAGGDGTVSLGLDIVDEVRAAKLIEPAIAPIAVIPMGTGNDLSRTLGFGGGYTKPLTKAEKQFEQVIRRLYMARPCNIDRFSLTIIVVDNDTVTAGFDSAVNGHRKSSERPLPGVLEKRKERRSVDDAARHPYSSQEGPDHEGSGQQQPQQHRKDASSPSSSSSPNTMKYKKVFTNYFSIGFDAEVAKQFGDFRDHNPQMCKSRVTNMMWYGCFGCNAMCCSSTLPSKRLSLTLDGKTAKVPPNMKALVVSNMITYAGGNVLWADGHHNFDAPAVDDGKVEVVALEGVWHMVGVGTHTRSGRKLGQCATIVLYAPANLTMQYDGEAIAAMGTSDQMVKVVIAYKSKSLGMRMPSSVKENNDDALQVLHSEREYK